MPSLLEAQIDFLGRQMQAMPIDPVQSLRDVEQAVAVFLSFYEQIQTAEEHATGTGVVTDRESVLLLYEHWLRSADHILPMLRELKQRGDAIPQQTPELLKASMRARGIITSAARTGEPSNARPLDEVQRELQGLG